MPKSTKNQIMAALASIVLSWVERGMPSSVIKRMDDFDILVEGCLEYTMERLAQKNGK